MCVRSKAEPAGQPVSPLQLLLKTIQPALIHFWQVVEGLNQWVFQLRVRTVWIQNLPRNTLNVCQTIRSKIFLQEKKKHHQPNVLIWTQCSNYRCKVNLRTKLLKQKEQKVYKPSSEYFTSKLRPIISSSSSSHSAWRLAIMSACWSFTNCIWWFKDKTIRGLNIS